MTDHSADDLSQHFTRAYWDERYAGSDHVWSGNPNPRLVEQVADLPPGRALDVGCGEGADVVWLAQQGWEVTGADVSGVALDRAREHAEEHGVGGRTDWVLADVLAGDPLPGRMDLVTSHYLHAPPQNLGPVVTALGEAVVPGGTLLVVGHHADDAHTGLRNPELSELLFTPEAIADHLDPEDWDVRLAEKETREHSHHGEMVTVTDTVVRAVRR